MTSASLYPVILCGGSGSRLWPASTPERPKPFLALTGPRTLLQETALRVSSIPGANTLLVVASANHADLVRAQLAEIGVACRLITEPGGRGSAPAVAAAALEIMNQDRAGVALVVASDHHVPDRTAFHAGVAAASVAAASGAVVIFGVKPAHPSAAYGYVLPGKTLVGEVRAAARFREKPSAEEAVDLVGAGWLWNSGNFVFRADVILDELNRREPELLAAVRAAYAQGIDHGDCLALGESFLSAPDLAIDVAVMERTDHGAVLPVDYVWSDLGAWDAVLKAAELDPSGNAIEGHAVVVNSRGCLIRSDAHATVVAVGLRDVAVIVEAGHILVCDLAAAQSVRLAARAIEDA